MLTAESTAAMPAWGSGQRPKFGVSPQRCCRIGTVGEDRSSFSCLPPKMPV